MSTEGKPLNHLNDVLIKYIFFHEDRKDLTLSLVNAFFEAEGTPPLVDFTFADREAGPEFAEDKRPHFDLRGKCSDGTMVEVEFQGDYYEAMEDRVLYYWSRMFQLRKGRPYTDLNRTVCIAIMNFDLFPEELVPDYRNTYMVLNTRTGHRLSPKLELHTVELLKYDRMRHAAVNGNSQLERWLTYFSSRTTPEELEEIAMGDFLIQRALDAEKPFLADPDLVTAYEIAERAEHDAVSRDLYHEKKGRDEGREEAFRITARNLLAMQMPQEQIARATGLALAEIAAIAAEEA